MKETKVTSAAVKPLTEKELATTSVTVIPGELNITLNQEQTKVFTGWTDGTLVSVTFNYRGLK